MATKTPQLQASEPRKSVIHWLLDRDKIETSALKSRSPLTAHLSRFVDQKDVTIVSLLYDIYHYYFKSNVHTL
jgi:hypothetical protein